MQVLGRCLVLRRTRHLRPLPASSRWRNLSFYELNLLHARRRSGHQEIACKGVRSSLGRYYRSGRQTVGEDVARTELARRLVQLLKEGIKDEGRLAEAGLNHLRQLPVKGDKAEP